MSLQNQLPIQNQETGPVFGVPATNCLSASKEEVGQLRGTTLTVSYKQAAQSYGADTLLLCSKTLP